METVGFVPEPNCGRGTVGIIWSCLTTILLSTWTAVHINVPETPQHYIRDRHWSTMSCLIIPESCVMSAVQDLSQAWALRKLMRSVPGYRCWSLKQSFSVVFDGVCTADGEVLYPVELHTLASSQHLTISDLPTDVEINTRCKSDGIAKTIAIVQATWFGANVVSRLSQHQTVTPLEDMTVAYTICGLAMFLLWFGAPQDVQQRVHLSTSLCQRVRQVKSQTLPWDFRRALRSW
ncbi:hypothetical protein B0T14DRAFT_583870 [Immersiella caudata]|uniref:Uncharacterized protein n=1 Tax=Immersiella caudata TaxID=314043 RepID=A0AA40C464_9PEZI|nr:hypothetical protein B0T14DRAFT_583870 [Immersiella caudata]